jgi:HlyD family secretion protein
VEAAGRNLSLAPPVAGQVAEVLVHENERVPAGAPLYRLDDRIARASLLSAKADISRAEASVAAARIEIESNRAAVRGAAANIEALDAQLADAEHALERDRVLRAKGVLAERQYYASEKNRDAARARVDQARAQLDQARILVSMAEARLGESLANLGLLRARAGEIGVEIERLTVRAPMTGRVLQINIRPGEFVTSTPNVPPIIFGETDQLQVRVDIDESSAARVKPGSPAVAFLKGDAARQFPLEFLRIEPYVQPKKSLTGDNTERVDVRVLQVIYRFTPPDFPVYVGQQVEVFIDLGKE